MAEDREGPPRDMGQNYQAVQELYDRRVESGQLKRQQEDLDLQEKRSFVQELLAKEIYKPDSGVIRITELGCGIGATTSRMLSEDPYFADPERKIVIQAIDLSEKSLEGYRRNIFATKPNAEIITSRGTIRDNVKCIKEPLDNIISTGVFQVPPDELRIAMETLLPKLKQGGAFIFQFMPPQKQWGETNTGGVLVKKGLGDYNSYRFPKLYINNQLAQIRKVLGIDFDYKLVDAPATTMRHPLDRDRMITSRTYFLVLHKK